MTKRTPPFSPEVRERAVRMVLEHQGEHDSQYGAIRSIAAKIGCSGETLRNWVRQAERDQGQRAGPTTDERERIKALEREIRELRQANEILRKGIGVFCPGGARPPVQAMIAFIDDHREAYGVEPICRVLPIAPSTYHAHVARRADPGRLPARAKRDAVLMAEIRRVFEANFRVYGVRKVWRQLGREGIAVARCTVARLMRAMGLQGRRAGQDSPDDDPRSGRGVPARPGQPAVQGRRARTGCGSRDFTYVATWSGFVYVAFVIDVFARRIVGWRVSRSARADFVLDALEQALHERRPFAGGGLVCHSRPRIAIRAASATPSVSPRQVSNPPSAASATRYDNALAETIIGLFKTEVIHRRGPWRSFEAVEFATLEWVDWFNTRRLLEPIGNIPPAEAEARYYAQTEAQALAA